MFLLPKPKRIKNALSSIDNNIFKNMLWHGKVHATYLSPRI